MCPSTCGQRTPKSLSPPPPFCRPGPRPVLLLVHSNRIPLASVLCVPPILSYCQVIGCVDCHCRYEQGLPPCATGKQRLQMQHSSRIICLALVSMPAVALPGHPFGLSA